MTTIVLTGGGSAGHCTPHLAILPHLKKNFDNIYYIGSEKGIEKDIISKTEIPYYSITCAKLKRKFTLENLTIPFKVRKGVKEAGKLLDQLKPDVIFSKGGYVSLPTVIAAKKRNIPVVAHESDYTVGLANKISCKYCDKVLTSFPETANHIKNGVYIGSPLRQSLVNVKEKNFARFGFKGEKPVLLIIGGSLGATKINQTVRQCLDCLLPHYDLLHICGKNNILPKLNRKGYCQLEYINDVEQAFNIASVAITRAGSNALFELLSLKIPCVAIPLPKGISRGDQELNAAYFEKLGVLSVLEQKALTCESLLLYVNSVYKNRFVLKKNMEINPINDKSPDISKILSDYIRDKK